MTERGGGGGGDGGSGARVTQADRERSRRPLIIRTMRRLFIIFAQP
jgi:hypothetical protein